MGILIAFFALILMALSRNPSMNEIQTLDLFLDKFVQVNGVANWILIVLVVLGIVVFLALTKLFGSDFAAPAILTGTCGTIALLGWVIGRIVVTIAAAQAAAAITPEGVADPTGLVIWLIIGIIPMLYGS